mmetsp:Transcript_114489/g.324290  ORF Transcript_114489/g.324290 Transcript_114489/m.324290 type:complete len:296 (-) Transcript_114489:1109-1996(-)
MWRLSWETRLLGTCFGPLPPSRSTMLACSSLPSEFRALSLLLFFASAPSLRLSSSISVSSVIRLPTRSILWAPRGLRAPRPARPPESANRGLGGFEWPAERRPWEWRSSAAAADTLICLLLRLAAAWTARERISLNMSGLSPKSSSSLSSSRSSAFWLLLRPTAFPRLWALSVCSSSVRPAADGSSCAFTSCGVGRGPCSFLGASCLMAVAAVAGNGSAAPPCAGSSSRKRPRPCSSHSSHSGIVSSQSSSGSRGGSSPGRGPEVLRSCSNSCCTRCAACAMGGWSCCSSSRCWM